jgi:hypothetical protein
MSRVFEDARIPLARAGAGAREGFVSDGIWYVNIKKVGVVSSIETLQSAKPLGSGTTGHA